MTRVRYAVVGLGHIAQTAALPAFTHPGANVRLRSDMGGGPRYDIGIYCVQAARTLFRADPREVTAAIETSGDRRFDDIEEMASAILRFPEHRFATFTASFGAADVSSYRLIGTQGDLRVDPACHRPGELSYTLTVDGKTSTRRFPEHDLFAPEILYFSERVLRDRDPEPSGSEGMIDVQIIEALYRSARLGRSVRLPEFPHDRPPTARQKKRVRPAAKPEPVNAASPAR